MGHAKAWSIKTLQILQEKGIILSLANSWKESLKWGFQTEF